MGNGAAGIGDRHDLPLRPNARAVLAAARQLHAHGFGASQRGADGFQCLGLGLGIGIEWALAVATDRGIVVTKHTRAQSHRFLRRVPHNLLEGRVGEGNPRTGFVLRGSLGDHDAVAGGGDGRLEKPEPFQVVVPKLPLDRGKSQREPRQQYQPPSQPERRACHHDSPIGYDSHARRGLCDSQQNMRGRLADQQRRNRSQNRQQEALRHQLPDQPPTAGADGEPDFDFALAGESSREQHISQVGAGGEQHQKHQQNARGHEQHRLGFERHGVGGFDLQPFVPAGILRLLIPQLGCQRAEMSFGRLERNPRLEPREHLGPLYQPMAVSHQIWILRHRHPDERWLPYEAAELGRRNPYHSHRFAVQPDGLQDNCRIAPETALPIVVAEHHHRR